MTIHTPRLELMAATMDIVHADLHSRHALPAMIKATIGHGWPPPLIDVAAMERIKQSLQTADSKAGWTAWYALLKNPRTLIGIGGFKSPPGNGAVEIGYSLLPTYHGKGLGAEFVTGLVEWAFQQPGVEIVFAETLPELIASQRVLIKNGFTRTTEASEPGVMRFERRQTNQAR